MTGMIPRPTIVVPAKSVRRRSQTTVDDGRPTEHARNWLLGLGAIAMLVCGILAHNPVVTGSGAAMAGVLVLWRLAVDCRSGVTSSNWGTWRRDQNPRGFRRNVAFWGMVAAVWFVLGAAIIVGLVRVPSP
jgi:hypothetical protein